MPTPSRIEQFAKTREYIDACLNPASAPEYLRDSLTTDSRRLLDMIDVLEATLPDTTIPDYPDFTPLPQPDLSTVRRKRIAKALLAWQRQNAQLRTRYAKDKDIFLRRHVAAIPHFKDAVFERRVLERLRREVKQHTVGGLLLTPERLNWVIMKSGSEGLAQIRHHCDQLLRRHSGFQIEFSRIERVYHLRPDAVYCGIDEFDGYLVFYFGGPALAVLECPIVGNAVYLIRGDWVALSRLSKTELLRQHSKRVSRIVHTDGWITALKRHLTKRCSQPLAGVRSSFP